MDDRNHSYLRGFQHSIQKRLRNLSQNVNRKIGHNRKGLSVIILLIASIIAGYFANEYSQKEATLRWERDHLPSSQVIHFALQSQGMHTITNENHLHRAIRTLPLNLDQKGSVWLSTDSNWVAFFADPNEVLPPKLYCFDCKLLPKAWNPIGIGWNGLETVSSAIEKHLLLTKNSRLPAKNRVVYRDPRQIVF